MRLYVCIMIAIIFLIGCKQQPEQKNDVSKANHIASVDYNDQYSEKIKVLVDQKLVGLTYKKNKEKESINNYIVDFSAACMCDTSAMLINSKLKTLYLFNYCIQDIPPKSKDFYLTYAIDTIKEQKNKIVVYTKATEELDALVITFIKKDTLPIYTTTHTGSYPKEYIGSKITQYYTTYKNSRKIKIEDCGDFDG